jgi:hypothetical protein
MFAVELYAKIRRSVMIDGMSEAVCGSSEHDHKDSSVFDSAGLPA